MEGYNPVKQAPHTSTCEHATPRHATAVEDIRAMGFPSACPVRDSKNGHEQGHFQEMKMFVELFW